MSLFTDIERHVHDIGGSKVSIRDADSGSGWFLVAFLYEGEPKAALVRRPTREQRKNVGGVCSAIAKAIR